MTIKRDIVEILKGYRDDPMWANHAEVNKIYLDEAVRQLTALRKVRAEAERERDFLMNAQIVGRDELEARVLELEKENERLKDQLSNLSWDIQAARDREHYEPERW
jgi:hypothetical protein